MAGINPGTWYITRTTLPDALRCPLPRWFAREVLGYLEAVNACLGADWLQRDAPCEYPQMARPCIRLSCPLSLVGEIGADGWPRPYHRRPIGELEASCLAQALERERGPMRLSRIASYLGWTSRERPSQIERAIRRRLAAVG
jgi:hypothetical protein